MLQGRAKDTEFMSCKRIYKPNLRIYRIYLVFYYQVPICDPLTDFANKVGEFCLILPSIKDVIEVTSSLRTIWHKHNKWRLGCHKLLPVCHSIQSPCSADTAKHEIVYSTQQLGDHVKQSVRELRPWPPITIVNHLFLLTSKPLKIYDTVPLQYHGYLCKKEEIKINVHISHMTLNKHLLQNC